MEDHPRGSGYREAHHEASGDIIPCHARMQRAVRRAAPDGRDGQRDRAGGAGASAGRAHGQPGREISGVHRGASEGDDQENGYDGDHDKPRPEHRGQVRRRDNNDGSPRDGLRIRDSGGGHHRKDDRRRLRRRLRGCPRLRREAARHPRLRAVDRRTRRQNGREEGHAGRDRGLLDAEVRGVLRAYAGAYGRGYEGPVRQAREGVFRHGKDESAGHRHGAGPVPHYTGKGRARRDGH